MSAEDGRHSRGAEGGRRATPPPQQHGAPSGGGPTVDRRATSTKDNAQDAAVANLLALLQGKASAGASRGGRGAAVPPLRYAPGPQHQDLVQMTREDIDHKHTLVGEAMVRVAPVSTPQYDGPPLSPRGMMSANRESDNRYVSLSAGGGDDEPGSALRRALLLTPEDVVAQIYVQFDEDMTKVILNVLDRLSLAESARQADRMKQQLGDELLQVLGLKHFALVQGIIENAKDVFLRLLDEFCSLTDEDEAGGGASSASTAPQYGATVRFVKARGKVATELDQEERWLKHMTRRYRQLTEESELNALFKKDLSLSGVRAPANTTALKFANYMRFNVPPPVVNALPMEKRICVANELPEWTHAAFGGVTHLNTIQTKVFEAAFHTSQNMLICAPTGAGKTMVALLVMLRLINEQMDGGVLDRDFKIIYVAPMKALAAEMVTNFARRLSAFRIVVREFTGDMQLSKREIAETNVIVTTPEKWDVVTRKQLDTDLVRKARLIIMDEIHLLNDDRGPVLEALVARMLRAQDMDASFRVRLVGLSATLPNYKDVAQFLRVDVDQGLKVFGAEYRPVPLEQTFIGTTITSRFAKEAALDELCYKEVVGQLRLGYQVMVFVHSRKQTLTLARWMSEQSKKRKEEYLFAPAEVVPPEGKKKGLRLQGKDLATMFNAGLGVHHAGLIRFDRTATEDLFRDGHIRVLCCTATLAWGVNLPAHTVIIRGTEIYNPQKGGMTQLSVLDVMQIFGRAGRPQYDTSGHGIIVSTIADCHHYLRLISQALPIESKFQTRLCDHLNAEIHAGTVTSVAEGVRWLEYTYLWQRIRVNPLIYGLTISDVRRDPELKAVRYDIVARAAASLNEACMARYNPDTGSLDTTDLGRIASHYYVEHTSMQTFNDHFRRDDGSYIDTLDLGEAMNTIACANEFAQLRARQDELEELDKIHEKLPQRIQRVRLVGESTDETSIQWKVTTLLKAYISRIPIEMHSLSADMNYIVQNGSRITRALFEIELQRGHPHTTATFLNICKCIERRCWPFQHPVVQFDGIDFSEAVLQHLDAKKPSMQALADMSEREIGFLVHNQRFGGIIRSLTNVFPSFTVTADVQPVTRTILRVKATIVPSFAWSDRYHGGAQHFWLMVEDQDNNYIFHQEQLIIRKKDVMQQQPTVVNLTIPIVPQYDTYCVRVYSDSWLGCEDEYVFSIAHLHLPDEAPPSTKLLPMTPLGRHVIPERFHPIYQSFTQLNAVQSQVFHAMYHTDHNILLGAPTGSGKTVAAEMAMLRTLEKRDGGKVLYVAPLKALMKERLKDWNKRFTQMLGMTVVELSGDSTPDIAALSKSDILCTTPEKWDGISRNWQVRSYVTSVKLIIFDEIHMLGSDRGPVLEVIVSRMRYIGWHTGNPIRLIGLSTATANPGDLASWLGVDKKWCLYNFEPSVRPVPMRCHIAGYPGRHYCPRMATMNKPTYNAIVEKSPAKPVLVFVSSRRQTRLTAMALINFLMLEQNTAKFVRMTVEEITHSLSLLQDPHVKHIVQFGIGIHHAGLAEGDKSIIEDLFRNGKLQILVATSTLAWGVNFPAHLVIVKGTEFYDGKTKSYIDYPLTDVLQMIGRAGRPQFDTEGVAQVLCHEPKKNFFRKFLYDPFPVESSLHKQLHAHINAEIVSGTIGSRQDAVDYLTWTYMFRRLVKNPSYYGLEDSSPKALTVFLSALIKKVLYDLETSNCIEPPDMEEGGDPNVLRFTVLGRICSYYYLSHVTASLFDKQITASASHVDLLKLMCEAAEFDELPVRHNEDKLNLELAARVPLPIDARNAESPHVKAYLLFQAHFSRARLPISDYVTDQKSAMDNSVRVIQAMVDVAANNGQLQSTLRIMTLMQCIVQARWWHENSLLQLPHVTEAMLPEFAAKGILHAASLANATSSMLHATRRIVSHESHGLSEEHVEEIMFAISRLPLVDVHLSLERGDTTTQRKPVGAPGSNQAAKEAAAAEAAATAGPEDDGDTFTLTIELTRLSSVGKFVVAPKFPKQKDEQYWVAIGNEATGELVALKRINRLHKKAFAKLVFEWDDDWGAESAELQAYVICDSVLGLDQQYSFTVRKP